MFDGHDFTLILNDLSCKNMPVIHLTDQKTAWGLLQDQFDMRIHYCFNTLPDLSIPIFVHRIGTFTICTNNTAAMLLARCRDAALFDPRSMKKLEKLPGSLSEIEREIYRNASVAFGPKFLEMMQEKTISHAITKGLRLQYLYILAREMRGREQLRTVGEIIERALGVNGPPLVSGSKADLVIL